ncbi:MAG TPA: DUF2911 domain-containing protein [Gemmatimonadales bacterium]|nr:DUF2911 domain-containing protein [Gemmatimonadales bacterium]
MKVVHAAAFVAAVALAGVRAAHAQAPARPPLRLAASTLASVEVHLNARKAAGQWFAEDAGLSGPSRIAITYGQPHARGRRVEGGLIPTDTVWRFGANAATTLHTDVDLRLGGLAVPPGDYSLFVLHARDGWSLIVNRGTGQWGTDRDAARDLGSVPLTARALAEPEGSLSVYLVPDAADPSSGMADLGGVLRIKWGGTELAARWQVQP